MSNNTTNNIPKMEHNGVVRENFVSRLYQMLSTPRFEGIVSWNETSEGPSFIILDTARFQDYVLVQEFNHANFSSFVRQLNKYDFHKVKFRDAHSRVWEFQHPDFRPENKDKPYLIKRKQQSSSKKTKKDETNWKEQADIAAKAAEMAASNTEGAIHSQVTDLETRIARLEQNNMQFLSALKMQQRLVERLLLAIDLPESDPEVELPALDNANPPSESIAHRSFAVPRKLGHSAQQSLSDNHQAPLRDIPAQDSGGPMSGMAGTGMSNNNTMSNQNHMNSMNNGMNNGMTNAMSSTMGNMNNSMGNPIGVNAMKSGMNNVNMGNGPMTNTMGGDVPSPMPIMSHSTYLRSPNDSSMNTPMPMDRSGEYSLHSSTMASPVSSNPLVLMAVDDPKVRDVLYKLLMKFGCHVESVDNGVDAVSKAENNSYDFILLDAILKALDGLSAVEVIRQFNGMTPILLMSDRASVEDHEAFIAKGVSAVLYRPFSQDRLYNALRDNKLPHTII